MIVVKTSQNVNFHIASALLKHVHWTTPCPAFSSPAHSIAYTPVLTPCRSDAPFSRYKLGSTPVSGAIRLFRPFRVQTHHVKATGN